MRSWSADKIFFLFALQVKHLNIYPYTYISDIFFFSKIMFSDAAVNLLRAAKANPTATAVCCTAFGFYTVRVHYMKRTLSALEEHNRELQAALKEKKDTIGQRLAQLEEVVKKDLTQRDAFIRKMELQNVEQTRSVDRLQHALRMCSTTGGPSSAAAQNAQNILQAHQQQQQLATAPHLFRDQLPKEKEPVIAIGSATVEMEDMTGGPTMAAGGGKNPTKSESYSFVVTQPENTNASPATTNSATSLPQNQASENIQQQPAADSPIIVVQEVDRLEQLRNRIGQQVVPPVAGEGSNGRSA